MTGPEQNLKAQVFFFFVKNCSKYHLPPFTLFFLNLIPVGLKWNSLV